MDRQALSFPILLSMVIGSMIGTGIYVLPALLAQYGIYALVAWVLTSTGAIFFALTLAALNKRFPKTGGLYIFCRQAYGKLVGFLVAYLYWISNLVSIAAIAVASISYLGYFDPALDSHSPQYNHIVTLLFELGAVWLFTTINIIGIHTAGVIQLILTVVKILPLLVIALLGLQYVHLDNFSATATSTMPSSFSMIGSAAALTFWAYIGIESATVPAENTRGWRDIYRATVYGACIASFVYILCTFVIMGMIPSAILQNTQFPFAEAGRIIFGPKSALAIALCAVISGLGALNVTILVQGQIVFAAARDKLFPKIFSKLSKHDVPVAGQILSSSLVSLLLIVTLDQSVNQQFENIALLAGMFTLMAYFASALSELKFLHQDYGITKALWQNKSTYIALLASFYCFWMLTNFTTSMMLFGCAVICFLILIYAFAFKKHVV